MPDCTVDSWKALDIEHSATPENLPVPSGTEVTVQCAENYSTVKSVVKCGTDGKFTITGDKPNCQLSGLYPFVIYHNVIITYNTVCSTQYIVYIHYAV